MANRTLDLETEARMRLMEAIEEYVDLDWDLTMDVKFRISCRSDYDKRTIFELVKIRDYLENRKAADYPE